MFLITLIFYHVSPFICDAFAGFFPRLGCENYQTLIFVDHVTEQWPVPAILGHSGNWEPILHQARVGKHFSETLRGGDIVFDKYGDDF